MAVHTNIVPFIKKWEGGLSRHSNDGASKFPCPTPYNGLSGWHTNKGITYEVWVKYFGTNNDNRFFTMSDADWAVIFKNGYWDKVKGDEIKHQSIANVLVSWAWGSGPKTAILNLQKAIGFKGKDVDGIIGPMTLGAINSQVDEECFFNMLCNYRESWFRRIATGKNAVFLTGWLNRLNDFRTVFKP